MQSVKDKRVLLDLTQEYIRGSRNSGNLTIFFQNEQIDYTQTIQTTGIDFAFVSAK